MKFRRRADPLPAVSPRVIDRLAAPLDNLLELLLEQTGVGVMVIDRRGTIVRASGHMRAMVMPSLLAVPGQPALRLFAADSRAELWDRMQPALLGRRPDATLAATLKAEDAPGLQAGIAVEITLLPLREVDGGISGLILRVADVTVHRQLEQQLAQSQKLQAVGQLAAGIAHDFNNLLQAISGAADLIAARPGIDPQTAEDAAQIRGSADRGGNLVRQLLAFGRQQALLPQVIAIDDAITGLSGLLRRLLGSRVHLVLDLEQPGQLARVDPTQLDQVLINLAVNARDAMPDGGTLTLRSGHITLHRPLVRGPEAIPPGRYVMIEVQDTGTGIPPESLPRIFDPFFSTKRDRGGTGLGLSTVHGIIRQSGGFLGVESEPGAGTRLRVYLPRHDNGMAVAIPAPPVPGIPAPAAAAPARQDAPPVPARPGGRLVLLVDDEDAVRRLAERALTMAGWQVLPAASAEAALDLLAPVGAPVPQLVVSDMVMPGMDGAALVAQLRDRWPGLPAILVSGYAEGLVRDGLVRSGSVFMAKPYRLAELTAAAAAALDR